MFNKIIFTLTNHVSLAYNLHYAQSKRLVEVNLKYLKVHLKYFLLDSVNTPYYFVHGIKIELFIRQLQCLL